MSAEAWAEYLDWTRGADPAQYEITEERAWHRLQHALLGPLDYAAPLQDIVVPEPTPEAWERIEAEREDLDQGI